MGVEGRPVDVTPELHARLVCFCRAALIKGRVMGLIGPEGAPLMLMAHALCQETGLSLRTALDALTEAIALEQGQPGPTRPGEGAWGIGQRTRPRA